MTPARLPLYDFPMDVGLVSAVLDRARSVLPGLRGAKGPILRSIKCVLVPAAIGTRSVLVKAVVREAPVWRFYLCHERDVYEHFERGRPPPEAVRVPRLLASGNDFLVIERMPGEPLAQKRHDPKIAQIDATTWEALLTVRARLHECARVVTEPPQRATITLMRRRLLEDPSAPVAWIEDGIRRLHDLSILEARDAERMIEAISLHPETRFSHGDLLLRNVLRDGTGKLSLVDWECAGTHFAAWDSALLWVFAPPWVRQRLEMEHGPARRAFLACVAFALSREAFYRARGRPGWRDKVIDRLAVDRARVLADLRDAST